MVGAAFVAVHDRVGAQPPHRRENRAPQALQVGATLQRLSRDRARTVVEHDDGLDRVGFAGVRLGVLVRADQPLFFSGEEYEPDGPLGLQPRLRDHARRLEGAHRARAVVGRAGPQVPGIEVRADDDDLARVLHAADLGDGVPLGDRVRGQRVLDAHLEPRRDSGGEQPVEQRVVLVRHHDLGQRQHAVRRAAHVEEGVLLPRVEHDAERARAAQQVGEVVAELLHPRPRGRIRVAERREHVAEEVPLVLGIGGGHGRAVVVPHERRWPQHDPRSADLAAGCRKAVGGRRVDPDHRPPHGATARPGRPGPASRRQGMRPRRDQPGPHRAPRPGAAEPPRLEVRVEAVGPEALQRPVVCRASGGRAGEARPDDVGQVREVLHHLRVGERLIDERAGARRVHGELLGGGGTGEEQGQRGTGRHATDPIHGEVLACRGEGTPSLRADGANR